MSNILEAYGCINEYGEVTQRGPRFSTGDSFSFAGQVLVAQYHRSDGNEQYKFLKYRTRNLHAYVSDGVWARSKEYADKNRKDMMSRDQLSSNIVAMGMYSFGMEHMLDAAYNGCKKRYGFMTNTVDNDESIKSWRPADILGPEDWNAFRRARMPEAKPNWLTYLGDLQLLIGVYLKVREWRKTSGAPLNATNLIIYLLQSVVHSTWLSKKARRMAAPYAEQWIASWFTRNSDEPPIHLLYIDWLNQRLGV